MFGGLKSRAAKFIHSGADGGHRGDDGSIAEDGRDLLLRLKSDDGIWSGVDAIFGGRGDDRPHAGLWSDLLHFGRCDDVGASPVDEAPLFRVVSEYRGTSQIMDYIVENYAFDESAYITPWRSLADEFFSDLGID